MIDPDEDKISITVDLKEAIFFSLFDAATQQFTFKPQIGTKFLAKYEISIDLADNNVNPIRNQYKLTVLVQQDEEKNQNNNKTEDEIIERIIKSKDKSARKCGIKIAKVSRNGQMQLKITSSSNQYAAAIAHELKDSYIQVQVAEKSQITAKIVDVIQKLDYLQAKILKSITLETKNGYAYLPKGTTAIAPIPIQYSPSNDATNQIIFYCRPIVYRVIARGIIRNHPVCGIVYMHRLISFLVIQFQMQIDDIVALG
ncbi:hypothetical protein FGO68_gene16702 [Halteria grandinella]|uniref:Uncharacterized protein n=1 Tax=Halteria grandinella TaxID=5974 RepID=A0A8J8P6B5_HALGN|nr:hypothetical protein FGO68_gene16702 [Halteria grandinella]